MKFTALEEYGLRCILHLARKDRRDEITRENVLAASLTLGEVAEEEGLTQQYAGKIFRVLAKAGLVESERGRKGGYRLTRKPSEITLSEVLTALGGRFYERRLCARYSGSRPTCVHTASCAIRSVWIELQRLVDQVLTRGTLKDLVERERRMAEALKTLPEELALVSVIGPPRVSSLADGENLAGKGA
jgi:Rrf2 family protein